MANLSRLFPFSTAAVVAVALLSMCRSASGLSVTCTPTNSEVQGPTVLTTDYETLSNDILSNNFNPPLSDPIKLGPVQQQPFPNIGSAGACLSNDFIFESASIALSDVQAAAAAIFSQCFLVPGLSSAGGGQSTLTSNDGSGITVIFTVAPAGFAC
ncbi:uncharacterized protein Z520_12167 [Fonsecaea multimorphosa CBS 102226]|uniref:Ubiquitin 3 binding protein But2 C-terminal domain-containing protein n=1 Tax=Fonsecaea multimorphosa CBS 102226 TaxID=1442371 RepID=A0A0D2JNW3_9EURO|nr:uncharacterized protein Z520_12167 [Fonsecaea multimorphosa CBS 102226]KIX92174.1 hypothetical protein Z520_12167 [Fonsecaea multimorphosa CBS 102226]OAL17539.1 hypothetical protein AYO22_11574 [Fonsecaea multimorphosa]